MTRSEPVIRPATYSDAVAYYGGPPRASFKGFVAELDGEIIGIGGVFYEDGAAVAFSEMKEPMRKYRKAKARACRILCDMFDGIGRKVYAAACESEPTAPYLLVKLGFKPTGIFGQFGETWVRE